MRINVKLRDVIGLYTSWVCAVVGAVARGNLEAFEITERTGQLRDHAKAWIGEELLERRV